MGFLSTCKSTDHVSVINDSCGVATRQRHQCQSPLIKEAGRRYAQIPETDFHETVFIFYKRKRLATDAH